MTIPFPSAEDSNGKPAKEGAEKKQNSDRRKLVLGYVRFTIADL
jgi:hypothetical protein